MPYRVKASNNPTCRFIIKTRIWVTNEQRSDLVWGKVIRRKIINDGVIVNRMLLQPCFDFCTPFAYNTRSCIYHLAQ